MTLTELDNALDRIKVAIQDSRSLGREIEIAATMFLGDEMNATQGDSKMNDPARVTAKKSSNKLLLRSGKLYKSFLGGNDSLTSTSFSGGKLTVSIGSKLPYAEIQDKGGVIKGTPISIVKTRKRTTKMAQYFWAMYISTRNSYWKSLALHVEKTGSVTIKPTRYFTNAMSRFRKQFPAIVSEWLANAVKGGR